MTTRQVSSINVPFNTENVTKCRCPICPVQHKSQCVKGKLEHIPEALKSNNPLNPPDIPGEYCSQGLAACKDIDTAQSCICTTCQVFETYNLPKGQPVGYYCRDGKAHNK
jgi:hypothetical protein